MRFFHMISLQVLVGALLLLPGALSAQPTSADSVLPQLNSGGVVRTMWRDGDYVYVGGTFTTIGGQSRNNLAAFHARTGEVLPWNPNVNGDVDAVEVEGDRVYVGGDFTSVNGSPGAGTMVVRNRLAAFELAIESAAGLVDSAWDPNVSGRVRTLLVDGGHLYAGGDFLTVNGATARIRLASFELADGTQTGTADAWHPAIKGTGATVYSLLAAGNRVYVGGSFTSVNGTPGAGSEMSINNLAAFSRANSGAAGLVDSTWNPDVDGAVRSMISAEGMLVFGGNFTTVNSSVTRNCLAAVDLADTDTTGAVNLAWDPNVSVRATGVLSLSYYDTKLLAAGDIETVNGSVSRSNVAMFNMPGRNRAGTVASWNPAFSALSTVYVAWPDNRTIYVGGDFSTIAAQARQSLAGFNAGGADISVSHSVTDPTPALGQPIQYSVTVTNNGPLDATAMTVEVQPDPSVQIESASATSGSWNSPNWSIPGISFLNSAVDTKFPQTIVPPNGKDVFVILRDGNTVYVGGSFLTMGGLTRVRIAAFDLETGAMDTVWNPDVGTGVEQIRSMAIYGRKLYVGGSFSVLNGGTITQTAGAAIHIADGINTGTVDMNWNPDASGTWATGHKTTFYSLVPYGDKIYVCGNFNTLKTGTTPVSRSCIAALDPVTADPDPAWNPSATSVALTGPIVYKLLPVGDDVYLSGLFNRLNGGTVRSRLAVTPFANGVNTGTVDPTWDPNPNDVGFGMLYAAGRLYFGGSFTSINGGTPRVSLAALKGVGTTGELDTTWLPMLTSTMGSNQVQNMTLVGGDITVCGWFTSINGSPRRYLAGIPMVGSGTGEPTGFTPPYMNAPPWGLAQLGHTLFVGGGFYTAGAAPRNTLMGLNSYSAKSATLTLNIVPTGSGLRWSTAELMSHDVVDPDSTPGNHNGAEDDLDSVSMTVDAPLPPGTPDMTAATDTGASDVDDITKLERPTFTGTGPRYTTVTLSTAGVSQNGDIGTAVVASNGTWTITPDVDLVEAVHTLRATATEFYGNTSAQSGGLTAEVDLTSPTVASVTGIDSQTIDVEFDEPMASTGVVTPSNYTLSGSGQGTLSTNPDTAVVESGNNYRLEWGSGSQSFGGDITVTVSETVTDIAGNTLGNPNSRTHIGGGVPVSVSSFTLE